MKPKSKEKESPPKGQNTRKGDDLLNLISSIQTDQHFKAIFTLINLAILEKEGALKIDAGAKIETVDEIIRTLTQIVAFYWLRDHPESSFKLNHIIENAKPEIERIYSAMKKEVGFSRRSILEDQKQALRKAALKYFDEKRKAFFCLKRKHLEGISYQFETNQHKRDFENRIMLKIVMDQGFSNLFAKSLRQILREVKVVSK
jgi:hypothetical protein